jgi:hypothetical protein
MTAPDLARISHQLSAAAADPGMSPVLRSSGRLDVLSSTPAAPPGRASCGYYPLGPSAPPRDECCPENAANSLAGPSFSPDGQAGGQNL